MGICSLLALLYQWSSRSLERLAALIGTKFCIGYGYFRLKIKARTSGAAFAVGIGSFVAYKLLYRLIRSNCLFATLEQLSPEEGGQATSSTAEGAVELTEGFYAVRLGGEDELLRRLEDCLSEQGSATAADNRVAFVQVRQASALKQLFRRNQRIRCAGIAAFDQSSSGEEQPLGELARRRDILLRYGTERTGRSPGKWAREVEEDEQSLSGFSDVTSASRAGPNPRHSTASPPPPSLPEQFPDSDDTPPTDRPSSASRCSSPSSSGTRRSASLHLNCDNELCWENEFSTNSECTEDGGGGGGGAGLFLFREREGSLGGLSQLSAWKNLEEMFSSWRGPGGEEEGEEEQHFLLEDALENLRAMDRLDANANASSSSIFNLVKAKGGEQKREEQRQEGGAGEGRSTPNAIHQSCSFPFTAYRIVVQNSSVDPSEISSICGSSRSGLYEKHASPSQGRKAGPSTSQGLWELTSAISNGTNSRSVENPEEVSAGLDRLGALLGPAGAMFDSVISSHSHSSLASTSAQSRSRIGTGNRQQQPGGGGGGGIMYDSAICTDFHSSGDDEEWKEHGQEGPAEEEGTRPRTKSGIIRRFGQVEDRPLSKISEQSTPAKRASTPSAAGVRPASVQGSDEPSLEWF